MKNTRSIMVVLLGWCLLVAFWVSHSSAATAGGITRTNSGGGVTVKAILLHSEADEARFQVVLDTHSVDLDAYDLKALTVLRDENGKTYQPTRVENKGSGHHREIIVVFPKPAADVKRFEIVIKDVAGIKERSFLWDL